MEHPTKDPDVMDVNALNTDKRTDMMKKGLCFNCNKAGHISKFCPEKRRTSASTSTPTSPPSYPPVPCHIEKNESERISGSYPKRDRSDGT